MLTKENFKPYFNDRSREALAKVANGVPIGDDELSVLHALRESCDWDLAKIYRDRQQFGGPGWGPLIQEGREDLELVQAHIDKACALTRRLSP
jgi:hypothetical protein